MVTRRRVTLKDIAAELGLSHPTISRALAGHESISFDTRERVVEAARRLGYVANSGARLLRRGHSNVVGLLLPDIRNEFYSAVAQRLADECSERGYQLLLSITANDPDRELELVRALLEARPSGVIAALAPNSRDETISYLNNILCVQFMQVHEQLKGPAVTVGDSDGARKAIEHLLSLGHERIAIVVPEVSTLTGQSRLRGFHAALDAAGRPVDPTMVKLGPSTAEYGSQAVSELLTMPAPPTAVYLSSAPLSYGGMREISRRSISVPDALSVIVSGGSIWYDAWPGGLTSVTLPSLDLTDAAATQLFQRLEHGGIIPPDVISLSFQLLERGSTAKPYF